MHTDLYLYFQLFISVIINLKNYRVRSFYTIIPTSTIHILIHWVSKINQIQMISEIYGTRCDVV